MWDFMARDKYVYHYYTDEEANEKLDQILVQQELILAMLRADVRRDRRDQQRDEHMALNLSQLTSAIAPLTDAVDNIQQVLQAQAALVAEALASQGVDQAVIDNVTSQVLAETNELVAAAVSNVDPGTIPDTPPDPNDLPHVDNTLPGDLPPDDPQA